MTYKNKIFLLLLVLSLFVATPAAAKVYLVSVGVSDYPGRQNDLRLPHNDAATIQWLYKENKNVETVLLMNGQARLASVKSSMKKMFSKAKQDDIVVLFFSGHGVKGGFVCHDGILNYSYIKDIMSRCHSKNKMIFADACFSGALREGKGVNFNSFNNSNLMLFLSCRSNEVSIETANMTNGFFTYALQHGLRGSADYDKNRVITASELFRYVSAKVKKMSYNQQHPVMWGKFPNNMPVMRW